MSTPSIDWAPVYRVFWTPCPRCKAVIWGKCDPDETGTRSFVEGPPGEGEWFCQDRVHSCILRILSGEFDEASPPKC